MEYKANFLGAILIEIVWLSSQILFFHSIFQFTGSLGGWSEGEIWFFVGSTIFVDALYMFFLHDNMKSFSNLIRNGLMDFHLLRPISALFLACFRHVNVISAFNFICAFVILATSIVRFHLEVDFLHLVLWFVYIFLGFSIVAGLAIIVCSLAFWTTQTSYLMWLFHELYRTGFRPESFYGPLLRRILLSFFPAAFFISIPTQIALGKLQGAWFLYPWLLASGIILATKLLWRAGVKNYEGALS